MGSTGQGRAEGWETPGGSVQLGRTTGGAEGLKRDSRDKDGELDDFDSGGGGRGRLGGTPRRLGAGLNQRRLR